MNEHPQTLHCKMLLRPDYRNRGRQKYRSPPECDQASCGCKLKSPSAKKPKHVFQ